MGIRGFIVILLLSYALSFDDCFFNNSVDLTDTRLFGGHLYEPEPESASASASPEVVGIDSFGEVMSNPLHSRYCYFETKKCLKFCCDPKNCLEVAGRYWTCWGRLSTFKEYSSDLYVIMEKDGYRSVEVFKNGSYLSNYEGNATTDELGLGITSEFEKFDPYSDIALIVSIPFRILSSMIYGCVKELRDLQGLSTMTYLLTFALASSILEVYKWLAGFIVFSESLCIFIGYAVHFFFLSSVLWLTELGFNLCCYSEGRSASNESQAAQRRIYVKHSIAVWLIAAFQTGLMYCIGRFLQPTKPSNLIVGQKMCARSVPDESYITTMLYPYDVVLACVLLDLIVIIGIILNICITGRKVRSLQQPNHRQRTLSYVAKNLGIFFRLTIIMGISWLFEVFSYVTSKNNVREKYEWILKWTELFNAAQGIFIFILIITSRNVLKKIHEQYGVYKRTRVHRNQDPIILTRPQDCAVRFDCFRQNEDLTN